VVDRKSLSVLVDAFTSAALGKAAHGAADQHEASTRRGGFGGSTRSANRRKAMDQLEGA
jgi:hypothetical protein